MENKIENPTFVGAREVWHLELNFSSYLQKNIGILSDALDLDIFNPRREVGTGSGMKVDLLADLEEGEEDEDVREVVIENQFGDSDHKHLGQLIAYLASLKADTAIWIVEHAKPEHIEAVNWLNETNDVNFYLVKLEVVSIGNSPYAPILTLIAEPLERKVQGVRKNLDSGSSKTIEACRQWWQNLWALDEHKESYTYDFNHRFEPHDPKYSTARTRKGGLRFYYVVKNEAFRIEFALGGRKNDMKKQYQALEAKKQEIESAFGEPLEWIDIKEGKKTGRRRILYSRKGVGVNSPPTEWAQAQKEIIEKAKELQKVLRPHIDKL